MELVDLEAARMEALAALGEIAKDQLRNGDQRDFVIDIRRRSRCSEGFTFTPSRTECLANQQQPTDRSDGGKASDGDGDVERKQLGHVLMVALMVRFIPSTRPWVQGSLMLPQNSPVLL
jgi:hypothetical protein